MKTIEYKDLIASQEIGKSEKIQGMDASGKPNLTVPTEIVKSGGCGYLNLGHLTNNKWYRIAIGKPENSINTHSVLLNIGNLYVNYTPSSQLFYIYVSGFREPAVLQLANAGRVISKARILYKENKYLFLEVNPVATGRNSVSIAYSCNLNFHFQEAVEVSDVPEEGYTVKEFAF